MGRKKEAVQEETKQELPPVEETQPEGVKQTRKPKAIDVEALRTLADSHEDASAAQLLIERIDAYKEAEKAFNEAEDVLKIAADKVRKAKALLD